MFVSHRVPPYAVPASRHGQWGPRPSSTENGAAELSNAADLATHPKTNLGSPERFYQPHPNLPFLQAVGRRPLNPAVPLTEPCQLCLPETLGTPTLLTTSASPPRTSSWSCHLGDCPSPLVPPSASRLAPSSVAQLPTPPALLWANAAACCPRIRCIHCGAISTL